LAKIEFSHSNSLFFYFFSPVTHTKEAQQLISLSAHGYK
jgi:hypothetical protein